MYNIWNIPLSTCTLCLQKSYISKGIQPIFEIFASARKTLEGGHLGEKFQARRYFTFAMARWKLTHVQHLKFPTFNLYTLPAKTLYLQRYSTDFRNLCLISKLYEGGHLEGKLQERSYLSFAMARLKLCACTTFEISHFQPVDCACKNPICRKVFNRFSKSWAQLEDVEGGHLCGKIQARRYFTFAMARWKPCACTTFEISHFQSVHCPSKNPISRKVFNRFSKSLPQLDDVECGHFGVKIEARSYFTFAMARWELCHLQHLKFPTFNLYTVPAKILYLQRYSTDFRNLCLSSKESLRMDIWVESFKCAGILLLQWQGENFASSTTFEILPLSTCTLCQQKSYISKGIQPIFEIFASARRLWGWAFGWKVSGAQVFYFCNGKVKTLRMYNIWNFPLSISTLSRQKSYIPKGIQPIFEIFASARRCWGRAFGWKVSGAQVFYFCNGKVKTLRIYNIWNFPLSTCTLCLQKSYISKGIQPIFEIFASARRCWGWAFGRKDSGAQLFYFCNGKVKTLRIDNIWNFATFNLYTVPAKILTSPKVFNRFSKSLPQLEDCWGWAFGWKVWRRAGILLLQWQGENFASSTTFEIFPLSTCTLCQQKSYISKGIQPIFEIFATARRFWGRAFWWKVSSAQVFYFCNGKVKTFAHRTTFEISATFNLYTVPVKILYLLWYSTDFRNLCLSTKMLLAGIWVESFRCADMVLLQWQGENFAHRTTFEIFPLSSCTLCRAKILYLQRLFNRFSKSLPQLEDFEGVHLGGKFQARRYGTFAMARRKLCACTTIEISHFQSVHCPSKNAISPMVFNRFSKSLPQHEDFVGGQLGGNFQARKIWYFCNGKEKILRMYNNWNFPLSTCILCRQKSYTCISKGIQPIFEIVTSAGRCWEWAFRWKVSSAQILYFCKGKVNTLRIDNIWNFATFNLHHVPAKIL